MSMTFRPAACVAAFLAATSAALAQSDARLRELADRYWDAVLAHHPTRATALGDYRSIDRLEDVSDAGRAKWKSTLESLLRDVRGVSTAGLSEDDALTFSLLERAIRDGLLEHECGGHFTPLNPLNGPHINMPLILVSQPFRNADDYRAYAARLRAFPKLIGDHIANMRAGVALGRTSPRVIIEKVIPQIRAQLVKDPEKSEFFRPARDAAAGLEEAERRAIADDIRAAIATAIIPAYLQLLAYVEDDYRSRCRETVGIGALSRGLDIYEQLAYLNTTVRMKPDEIHEIGLSEVARLRSEMEKIQRAVGFEGSLDDFLAHMRTDPKYRFNSGEELYRAADEILQRSKPRMAELFGRLPKADCVMKEIEPFRAASSPVAYYNPTPEDGSRPGYYYINTHAPEQRLRFTLEALSYHEAVPGHHLQMTLDQENKNLPKFRRYGSYTAYIEGWALYTEKLGYEIGGYADPYSRFGQLTFEMWRACRLVVDTGMHARGWTRQQAIDYMARNTSLAAIDIENEIDRYIVWPGQALGYKIGELRILQLRKEAEEKLGDRFNIKAFHDALLGGGAMPIDLLETRMREWMKNVP